MGNLLQISPECWGNSFLDKWDDRFIRIAEEVRTWSKDPNRKVGCVLVKNRRDISKGYNGFPFSLSDSISRLENKDFKGKVILHAEANAIINACNSGVSVEGCTAYITYHPCSLCASMLIQAGIVKIVCPSPDYGSLRWRDNFKLSSDILCEANVTVLYYRPLEK